MSRKKDKDRGRFNPSAETVSRHLKKGNFREALKDAKLCFRAEASEANRVLLEEAFLQRIQQLHHDKQPADAKAVLADLMAMGPTSPKVLENVARLRVLLGETGAGSMATLQSSPALVIEIADNAVLDPAVVVPNFADLPQHIHAVREALALVEKGDDSQALEHLAIIPRTSPLADWRLLIRGLSAFYNGDDERAESNWSRLEPNRPASRIARTLRLAAKMPGSAEQPADFQVEDGAQRLLNSVASPLCPVLKQLAKEWKNPNKRRFFATLRLLKQRFGESHAKVVSQVVEVVWKWAVRNASGRVLDELAGIGPASEFDPQWNRSRALLAEHPEYPSFLNDIDALWVAYAADVQTLEFLSSTDRQMAQGLVYQRLADKFRHEATMLEADQIDDDEPNVDGVMSLVGKAKKYYREGIRACPQLDACYLTIVKLCERYGQADEAADVMEELAGNNPDSFEAASWLASYHLSNDNPGKASAWVSKARQLRPRDPQVARLLWNQKLTMARGLVLNRQFEAARQEINDASNLTPVDNDPCALDLFRAGIELKAGNPEGAESHIAAAMDKVRAPAFVWMQMSSLAAVFRLDRDVRKSFDDRLSAEISKPLSSETAGRIAQFLIRMRAAQSAYVGRAGHERLFLRHLAQTKKIKWVPEDLKSVCRLLKEFPAKRKLRNQLLQLGVTKHSSVPQFAFWAAMEEFNGRRTYEAEMRLEKLLSAAVSAHNAGPQKLTDQELEMAMSTLAAVKEMIEDRLEYERYSAFDPDDDEIDDEMEFCGEMTDDQDSHGHPGMPGLEAMLGLDTMPGLEPDSNGPEIDEAMLDRMEQTLPPKLRRELEKMGKTLGIPVRELLQRFIRQLLPSHVFSDDSEDQGSAPKARKQKAGRTPF